MAHFKCNRWKPVLRDYFEHTECSERLLHMTGWLQQKVHLQALSKPSDSDLHHTHKSEIVDDCRFVFLFLNAKDTWCMWQSVEAITDLPHHTSVIATPTHTKCIIHMFGRPMCQQPSLTSMNQVICQPPVDVRKISTVNLRKLLVLTTYLTGVIRECTDQLADVLNHIFNISLSQAVLSASRQPPLSLCQGNNLCPASMTASLFYSH